MQFGEPVAGIAPLKSFFERFRLLDESGCPVGDQAYNITIDGEVAVSGVTGPSGYTLPAVTESETPVTLHLITGRPGAAPMPTCEQPKVLVTGFCDWKDNDKHLAKSSWRCRKNSSGMLLLKSWSRRRKEPAPSDLRRGPLSSRLLALKDFNWDFKALQVRWGAGSHILWSEYDVIINLGLDPAAVCELLQVENGAHNGHQDPEVPLESTLALMPAFLPPRNNATIIDELDGYTFGSYKAEVKRPRANNNYICNETAYYGIKASSAGAGRPRATLFLHLPYASGEAHCTLAPLTTPALALEALAQAVAGLISLYLEKLVAAGLLAKCPVKPSPTPP